MDATDDSVDALIGRLLTERIERDSFTDVRAADVERWCRFFDEGRVRHDVGLDGWIAPPEMVTTFLRPPVAPASGASAATNVALHERLKDALGLPVGIATGYELEARALVGAGDRLVSVERIAEVGPVRDTRFGRGRDWEIEVVSSFATGPCAGEPVCIERWRMTGYDPARVAVASGADPSSEASSSTAASSIAPTLHPESDGDAAPMRSSILVDRGLIVDGATANRVWATAHHDDDAALAAGLPGIIVDTSTWVALAARSAAHWLGGDPRVGSVSLSMRRPVVAGDEVGLHGEVVAEVVDERDVRWIEVRVVAVVRGRTVAVADVRLAVATAEGADVWTLAGERWRP